MRLAHSLAAWLQLHPCSGTRTTWGWVLKALTMKESEMEASQSGEGTGACKGMWEGGASISSILWMYLPNWLACLFHSHHFQTVHVSNHHWETSSETDFLSPSLPLVGIWPASPGTVRLQPREGGGSLARALLNSRLSVCHVKVREGFSLHTLFKGFFSTITICIESNLWTKIST